MNVWAGCYSAQDQARQEQEDARRAALTPEERAAEDAESEAAYWADMADAAREPHDPYDDKYQELVWEAQNEERWEGDADRYDAGDPYVVSHLGA